MGYLSQVSFVLKTSDCKRMRSEAVQKKVCATEDSLLEGWEIYEDWDGFTHIWTDSVKWYEGDPEVDFVVDFLKTVEHQFVRYGEDPYDIDDVNTFKNGEHFIGPTDRKIIRTQDIRCLLDMLEEIEPAIGRSIVHGVQNGDSAECITQNILSDVRKCVIERWGQTFFPKDFRGMEPSETGFPDDANFADVYEAAGYPLER